MCPREPKRVRASLLSLCHMSFSCDFKTTALRFAVGDLRRVMGCLPEVGFGAIRH